VALAAGPALAAASPGGVEAEEILPSIVPDELADHHAVEWEMCLRGFSSDAGKVAKIEAALGYSNVRVYPLVHWDFLRKQEAVGAVAPVQQQTNIARRR
jgi:DNA-binding transcriptional regulator YdaS (Cro superfamily)